MGKLNILFLLHYIWGKKREGRKNEKKIREKYRNAVDMLSGSVVEKVAVPPPLSLNASAIRTLTNLG